MTIVVPCEFEPIIQNIVASGAFSSPEDAMRYALTLLENEQGSDVSEVHSEINGERLGDESHESWVRRLREFSASCKPTGHDVDDSRESIYPDRS